MSAAPSAQLAGQSPMLVTGVIHKPLLSPTSQDLLAGTISGVISTFVCHPIDTLRVRLQTSTRFTSLLDAAQQTVRKEGALALYKGGTTPILGQGAQKATMFFSFGLARRALSPCFATPSSPNQPAPITLIAFCGAVAGLANSVVATPLELIRTRLQVQYHSLKAGVISVEKARYKGPLDCARQVFATTGLRGMYLGFVPTCARDIPGLAAWYAAFENSKRMLTKHDAPGEKPATWKLMASGASGGISYWTLSFATDTVKNYMQSQAVQEEALRLAKLNGLPVLVEEHKPMGMFATGRHLIANEGGIARLYRGFAAGLSRGVIGASLTFTVYTLTVDELKQL